MFNFLCTIIKQGIKFDEKLLIRSEASCRTDLIKWGAQWDKNRNRPYFEGHERSDVVEERRIFVDYFILNKNKYYTYHKGPIQAWLSPTELYPRILISHDESTYKSGEIQHSRRLFPENAPFYNKGKGRSIMLSMFMVQHPKIQFVELDESEWKIAVRDHPKLAENHQFLNYFPRVLFQ